MKNITAFYWIGTVGLVLTAFLHMVMTLFLFNAPHHGSWWGVYPVFITFLIIGTLQIYKDQKQRT